MQDYYESNLNPLQYYYLSSNTTKLSDIEYKLH